MGAVHVDELLDRMTPEEFDERFAAHLLERLESDDWTRHAALMCELHNQLERLIALWVGSENHKLNLKDPADYLPRRDRAADERPSAHQPRRWSAQEDEAEARRLYGK